MTRIGHKFEANIPLSNGLRHRTGTFLSKEGAALSVARHKRASAPLPPPPLPVHEPHISDAASGSATDIGAQITMAQLQPRSTRCVPTLSPMMPVHLPGGSNGRGSTASSSSNSRGRVGGGGGGGGGGGKMLRQRAAMTTFVSEASEFSHAVMLATKQTSSNQPRTSSRCQTQGSLRDR